jgi:Cys-rich protein (TIGR01571 family)
MFGLFGCPHKFFDMVIDFLVGIITYFCPCYIFGKNAEQLGESCVMYALSQFVPLLNLWCRTQVRGKIREQKGIEGTCIKDLLMVWCCPLCSLVQEARVSVADI